MAKVVNTISRSGGGTEITVVANYSALPDPTTVSGQFYWAEASQGTSWLPGSLGGTYYNSGMYYSNGVAWTFMNVPYNATLAEVDTGTNDNKFVTPSTLSNSTWAFTSAKVLATVLSTLSASSGTFTSSDSLITALNKTKYLIDNLSTLILGQVLTGFSASAGTVTSSDTILSAFDKIVGNINALPILGHGTYTPTGTIIANIDSISWSVANYMRVGSVVTVSGEVTFDPTSGGGTLANARWTLPIASAFANTYECNGGVFPRILISTAATGGITANVANDQAEMLFPANFTSSQTFKYHFQYTII